MEKRSLNILFVSLVAVDNLSDHNLYADVLRSFHRLGHSIVALTPIERRSAKASYVRKSERVQIIRYLTPNIQKATLLEKILGTLSVERLAKRAITKYCDNLRFDLVICSTPPITITNLLAWLRKQHNPFIYLLLKDIFPQNAVDLGMMKAGGFLHKSMTAKEKLLYSLVDKIGCMSLANRKYILAHNPELPEHKVEISPNSIEPMPFRITDEERANLIVKLGIPEGKRLFLYGGNLGKPQGIDFIITCLDAVTDVEDIHFLIVGSGTEYPKLESWVRRNAPKHVTLRSEMPKAEYDKVVGIADVGLIFLDQRFTIPNFPSRLLSYLEWAKPVWCVVDKHTDVGTISVANGFGLQSEAGNVASFKQTLDTWRTLPKSTLEEMGRTGSTYMNNHFHAYQTVDNILRAYYQINA